MAYEHTLKYSLKFAESLGDQSNADKVNGVL